ncbi:MAG: DUF3604 domain-containing protein [Myxococcales bacterium]|nr:DUF3604 domain-containing protein [Myxococcales bacterium]
MPKRPLLVLSLVALVFLGFLYLLGTGAGVAPGTAGTPQAREVATEVVEARGKRIAESARAVGEARPKQILFGDLHVHSTFSFDAFQMSLPMAGGEGAHPVSDACDYARHCAGLDFWSINDHAITLTPKRWEQTVEAIRQCNAVAGNTATPDLVTYLGWEWTQVGTKPSNHYGHKNVVLRDLEEGRIPTRPIAAGIPEGMGDVDSLTPSPLILGGLALLEWNSGGPEFVRYLLDTGAVSDCPTGVPVRDLPSDCRESARTPEQLFAKLDDWGHASLVIPHGTAWGFYTPPGSSWDKQLSPSQHDPARQRLVELYSGHGNSEEFRSFREVIVDDAGQRSCPGPQRGYLPSCWRAGEIIEARCIAEGASEEDCAKRAAQARQYFVDADFNGGAAVVPGTTPADWQDAGQCRDCFQPDFNYRPRSSVQYLMALSRGASSDPLRFRMGFMAASDNHSARPGTGYKEVARSAFTEARFGRFLDTPVGEVTERDPAARAEAVRLEVGASPFGLFETERQASFFLTGGLAAVHAEGRDRESLWDAMQRREVYGTSGPRILLWFDLLNAPGGAPLPMGSEVTLEEPPIFQVRAVGSLEPRAGCEADATSALSPERLERLCRGECYRPSEQRRIITRIEVVRIRPQQGPDERVTALVEDPWKILTCSGGPDGCHAAFVDDDYVKSGRDALYYVRAIEQPSQAIDADPLGCTRDVDGRCIEIEPCFERPESDDCLSETEQRAWSSPIFVDQPRTSGST